MECKAHNLSTWDVEVVIDTDGTGRELEPLLPFNYPLRVFGLKK